MELHSNANIINLMIYNSYADVRGFDTRQASFIKMQIDNLLRIGWPKSRIMLATNFEYEYRGIQTRILPDDVILFKNNRRKSLMAAKPDSLKYILTNWISDDQILLFHDQDAHQNIDNLHTPCEVYNYDMCLTSYNTDALKINTGVWFLKKTDTVFEILNDVIDTQERLNMLYDEARLTEIIQMNKYKNICVLGHEWNVGKHTIHNTIMQLGYRKPAFCHFSMDNYNDFCMPNVLTKEALVNIKLIEIINKHRVD